MNRNKIIVMLLVGVAASLSTFAQTKPVTQLDTLSYAIGVSIGQNFKQQGVVPNTAMVSKAIEDVLKDQPLLMDAEQCNNYIQSYFQNKYMNQAEDNRKLSEAFLEKNKTVTGVMTLPSGLQYKVLKQGAGDKPTATSKVKVHYEGKTIDGKEFDSSVKRGTPAEFGVTQVIKGWTEALQLMPVGSKWQLFIPADLAYGTQAPPAIGPNQTLIFDVELLEIVAPTAATE